MHLQRPSRVSKLVGRCQNRGINGRVGGHECEPQCHLRQKENSHGEEASRAGLTEEGKEHSGKDHKRKTAGTPHR